MSATGRILITGFEPFDDALNASEVLVDSLRDDPPLPLRPLAARVQLGILPVDTECIGERVAELLTDPPAVWLLTGQDAARGRICVETRAVNRRAFTGPDNVGRLIHDMPVVDAAPDELAVSMQGVADVVTELRERGIDATGDDARGARAYHRQAGCNLTGRSLKNPGPSCVPRFEPRARREIAGIAVRSRGFATQPSARRSARGDGSGVVSSLLDRYIGVKPARREANALDTTQAAQHTRVDERA